MKKLILSALLLIGAVPFVMADSGCCPTSCETECCETSCEPKCCEQKCHEQQCVSDCDVSINSQAFFSMRPRFQICSPEYLSMWRDRMHARENGRGGAVQVAVYGGRTTQSKLLASYFTPFNANYFTVAENDADTDTHIRARHLNIVTQGGNFKSTVVLAPQQSYIGVGLAYKQAFKLWAKEGDDRGYWFSASMPITHVRNSMNLYEDVINTGSGVVTVASPGIYTTNQADEAVKAGAVGTATAAFAQAGWCKGKIDSCNHTATRPEEITVLLGKEWVKEDICYLDTFFGFLIPTSNTPKGEYVFEPISGHNGHGGFTMGNAIGFKIWQHSTRDWTVRATFDSNFQYMFNHNETRSFDLKDNEWSRYMQVYASKEAAQQAVTDTNIFAHTAGINIFTREVKVKPRYARTYNTSLIFESGRFQAEAGYNFYAREAECVELNCDCPFPTGVALREVASPTAGYTSIYETIIDRRGDVGLIAGLPVSLYDDNVITEADLNLDSAEHPATTQHILYGSLGARFDEREFPLFVGIGGSYEFGPDNVSINRWTLWAKGGVSF